MMKIYVLVKYDDVWNKTKKILDAKFHIKLVYDEKYIKTKVQIFNGAVNTFFFSDDKTPEESIHCICIATTNMESDMRIDENNILKFIQKNAKLR